MGAKIEQGWIDDNQNKALVLGPHDDLAHILAIPKESSKGSLWFRLDWLGVVV